MTQKDYFDEAARNTKSNAILVPGASRLRNIAIDKAMRKALTPVFKDLDGLSIVEVGCGIGRWTQMLAEKNAVIGVDLSPQMVRMAQKNCRDKGCSFVVADVSCLPFKEEICDLVVSITVLQHILDKQRHSQALSEVARCSKSKALIVEEMWSKDATLLRNVYCPIQIVPVNSYVKELSANSFLTREYSGITPAVLVVSLTRYLARKKTVNNGSLNVGIKSSKLLSSVVHLIMGFGTLSAVFAPRGAYDPHHSMHTIMIAERYTDYKK